MSSNDQGAGRGRRKGGRKGRAQGAAARGPVAAQHPGEVLAQVIDDTPLSVAAKWFSVSESELAAVLAGESPMTNAMAVTAGTVFGTGAAPWIEMQRLWDEAHAPRAAEADVSKA